MIKTEDCRHGYTEAFNIAHARKMCLCFNMACGFESVCEIISD